MNERIMKAIEEIESIRNATMREYPRMRSFDNWVSWERFEEAGIEPPDIEQQYYYKVNKKCIPLERAISDRTRMLDVLRRFYCAHSGNHDGMDDFVTLFGVYCNHYIRFNLHQAMTEDKDFGISMLGDVVTDEKMQKYLFLLQQGIFNGLLEGEKEFLKAFELVPEYSLPALYLFIRNYRRFQEATSNQRQSFEDKMLYYAEHMNKALFNYCIGTTELLNNRRLYKERIILPEWFYAPLPYFHTQQPLSKTSKKIRLPLTNQAVTITPELIDVRIEDRDDDRFYRRVQFLSIPYRVEDDGGFFGTLLETMLDRYRTRKERDIVQQEKDEIVQDFSHTYQNMRATALYNMAKMLLNKPDAEDRKLGRTALLEYTRKETLTKDVYMMQLKYEHNTEKLRNILRQSCTRPSPDTYTIHDVLHQALLMCLVNAFYDQGTENARRMRSHLKNLWPDWKETILDFEKAIIFQNENCLKWLRAHGIDLRVEEEAAWQSIGFFPDGYAAVLLRNTLTELLVNTFKYGDLREPISLTFTAHGQAITIEMVNHLPDGKHGTSTSQVGIHSMGKMLHVLWVDALREDNERLTASYKDNKFHTYLSLPMSVFSVKEEAK